MLGAAKIIGVDKNSMKKDKGLAFGMTDFINPDECSDKSISQMIKDLTGGMGVDYCFECVGAEPLINQAIQATKEVCICSVLFCCNEAINSADHILAENHH